VASDPAPAIFPSTPGGLVCPSPVPYNNTTDPLAAGLVAELALKFWLKTAVPAPVELNVKIQGTAVFTGTLSDAEVWELYWTVIWVEELPATSYGTTPADCVAET
jgi:hypothetical protein